MAVRLAVCTTVAACFLAGGPAGADTTFVPEYAGAEAGLIGILCAPEGEAAGRRFRGVVIDAASANARHEVILTAAHGFPAATERVTEECSVAGRKNRRYPIRAIWRPDYRARGTLDDWAVVVTGRTMRERIWRQRIRTEPLAPGRELAIREQPVRLPLLFLGAERPCALRPPGAAQTKLEYGLFSHTCQSWSGHSGSPVLAADDNGTFVLGIHVSRRWIAETRESLRIGRLLDTEIPDAIRRAAAWRETRSR